MSFLIKKYSSAPEAPLDMRKSSIEKRIPLGRLDIPNTHEITFEHHVTTSNKYDVIKLPIKPTPVYPSNVKSQYSPLKLYTQIFTERKEPSTNSLTIENIGINTTLSNTLRRKNIPQCISPLNKSHNELRTMASLNVSRDASIDINMPTQTTPLFHVLRNSRDKCVTSNPVENITDKENNSPIIPVCHVTNAKVKYERTQLQQQQQQQQLGNIASLHNTLLSPLSPNHPEITMSHTSSNKGVSLLIVV